MRWRWCQRRFVCPPLSFPQLTSSLNSSESSDAGKIWPRSAACSPATSTCTPPSPAATAIAGITRTWETTGDDPAAERSEPVNDPAAQRPAHSAAPRSQAVTDPPARRPPHPAAERPKRTSRNDAEARPFAAIRAGPRRSVCAHGRVPTCAHRLLFGAARGHRRRACFSCLLGVACAGRWRGVGYLACGRWRLFRYF